MQILQMIIFIIILLFGAMYVAFKSPKLKMSDILNDLCTGIKMREDILNEMLTKIKEVSNEEYIFLNNQMAIFDELKKIDASIDKVRFDEKMDDMIIHFLVISDKHKSLLDDFRFVESKLKLKELEIRIINTKFRYNGFVNKYNRRRETFLGKIFSKLYRFDEIDEINLSTSLKEVLSRP